MITLNQVDDTESFTIITVDVKVVRCKDPITLGTKQKQVTISDTTGWGYVQLWEENIGFLEEGRCYKLQAYHIVEHEMVKSVAMCREGSETLPIAQIQNIVDPPNVQGDVDTTDIITLQSPRIASDYKLENFFKCLRCSSRTEPAASEFAEVRCCNSECGILNNSTFCDTFTLVKVLVIAGPRKIVLSAFRDMIQELLGDKVTPTET